MTSPRSKNDARWLRGGETSRYWSWLFTRRFFEGERVRLLQVARAQPSSAARGGPRRSSRTRSGTSGMRPPPFLRSTPARDSLSSASREPRQRSDRHVVRAGVLVVRRVSEVVRMVRVAVGLQLRAGARAPVLRVHARHAAQERERRRRPAALRRTARSRRSGPSRRVRRLDRGVALHVQLAVERRGRTSAARARSSSSARSRCCSGPRGPGSARRRPPRTCRTRSRSACTRRARRGALRVRPARRRPVSERWTRMPFAAAPSISRSKRAEVVVAGPPASCARCTATPAACSDQSDVHAQPGDAERAGVVERLVALEALVLAARRRRRRPGARAPCRAPPCSHRRRPGSR